MKNAPLYAIGSLFVLAAVSSSKSSSKKNTSTPTNNPQPGTPANGSGTVWKPTDGPIKLNPGVSSGNKTCKNKLEFYNEEKAMCTPFWVPGETEAVVETHINNELKNVKDKSFNFLCADKGIDENAIPNQNALQIIINVINKMWSIPKDQLPPKASSPSWIREIWQRSMAIYYDKVCYNPVGKS